MENQLILIQDLGLMFTTEKSNQKARMGLYKCFCGNEFKTRIQDVKSNKSKSCGCKKGLHRHGLWSNPLYNIWIGMMDRCHNEKSNNYKRYGGRGITVCNEWKELKNFVNDMYPSFQEGLSLDRIDNNQGYCKENCRWATQAIQARNTRKIIATNTSGYRGVYKRKENKYEASISVDRKRIYLGTFKTSLDAAKAYDTYVLSNKLEHTINGIGL